MARTQFTKPQGRIATLSRFSLVVLLRRALAVLLLAMPVVVERATALGQSEDVSKDDEAVNKGVPPDDKNKKRDKRGSLIIAPIPISSPAFGSGLLIISGYVFKFKRHSDGAR